MDGVWTNGRLTTFVAPPKFILIDGPNGSGKTSVVAPGINVPIINADEIARTLDRADRQAAAAEARVMASSMVRHFLDTASSFGIETTMNKAGDLSLLNRARRLGFETQAFIVWSGGFKVCLERVRLRVERNGHDVPKEEIRSRYESALEALALIVGAIDLATVIDNSRTADGGLEAVLVAEKGVIITLVDRPPPWLSSAFDRWMAPLCLGVSLVDLASDPRVYRARRLLAHRPKT